MSLPANAKKLVEYVMMDEKFRHELMIDPQRAFDERAIALSAENTSRYWNMSKGNFNDVYFGTNLLNDEERALFQVFQSTMRVHQFYYDNDRFTSASPEFRQWRSRMMRRNYFMMGEKRTKMSLLLPFGIELSDGCSGGCWFCGVGAQKYNGYYPNTPENLENFKQILTHLKHQLNQNAQNGFLYFASDPLDHPEYHLFSQIFYDINGAHPACTTALSDKHPDRAQRVMDMINHLPGPGVRFSVYSLRQLDNIFATFNNDDLVHVSFAQLAKGSTLTVANSGHARRRFLHNPERAKQEAEKLELIDFSHESINCLFGYLLNMVRGTISLVVPVNSSDDNPDGIEFLAKGTFKNADDVANFIETMRTTIMRNHLIATDHLKLQANINIINENGLVKLTTPHHQLRLIAPQFTLAEMMEFVGQFRNGLVFQDIDPKWHELTHYIWRNGAIEIRN